MSTHFARGTIDVRRALPSMSVSVESGCWTEGAGRWMCQTLTTLVIIYLPLTPDLLNWLLAAITRLLHENGALSAAVNVSTSPWLPHLPLCSCTCRLHMCCSGPRDHPTPTTPLKLPHEILQVFKPLACKLHQPVLYRKVSDRKLKAACEQQRQKILFFILDFFFFTFLVCDKIESYVENITYSFLLI